MNSIDRRSHDAVQLPIASRFRGRLFRKYIAFFAAVVCVALASNTAFEYWFFYNDFKSVLVRLQTAQAESAAGKIGQFFKEIEGQIGWTTQLPWKANTVEEWRFDVVRLLRQVPALTELSKIDSAGHEQLRVSRLAPDVIGSLADHTRETAFIEATANKIYYGPVYFRRESEPYMTLAMSGASADAGVTIAEVNLKFIWDVVSQIKVGEHGQAYVVDAQGRLIAHPDLSLALRNIDLSRFPQVQAARVPSSGGLPLQEQQARDIQGRTVLAAHAPVAPLGWLVLIELPVSEGYAFVYWTALRSSVLLLVALSLAGLAGLFLARRMIIPIQALSVGAARIGSGDLAQRISIETGDELEALGDQFNAMAAQLQESYSTLERKVEERTHELELANLSKSRFIAAASHDLRQPLHALGLFIAQLRAQINSVDGKRLIERIDASISAMNELFNALLDISRLDAGVLAPNFTEFPIDHLLKRIDATFGTTAREKGLSLRVARSQAWIRSDTILLERILLNLLSNAIRYTREGGVVVACRKRAGSLHIEVSDTGTGIPENQQRDIFNEFYQIAGPERDRQGGLGLGLAIVDRLCRLLHHRIELTSAVGEGSRFTIVVPLATARLKPASTPHSQETTIDFPLAKLIVVIDDDALVLEGTGGLLRSWGCQVVTGGSASEAIERLSGAQPDLIISDYHLSNGRNGIGEIEALRAEFRNTIRAFLISGDTAPEQLRSARASGYHLLHKPLRPMALRAIINQLLKNPQSAEIARVT